MDAVQRADMQRVARDHRIAVACFQGAQDWGWPAPAWTIAPARAASKRDA